MLKEKKKSLTVSMEAGTARTDKGIYEIAL